MVKYELNKDSIEVKYKDRKEIKAGVVLTSDNQEPELIKVFDNKDEALLALQDCRSNVRKFNSAGGTYFYVTEYYIQESIYDDDEWISGDIIDFSKMEIELKEKPSYNTLAVFDNMADAERAEDDYDGDDEVFLKI